MSQTNWYIITGGPSSGKTKVIEHLAFLGHEIRPEAARIYIDNELSKGRTLGQIRDNAKAFQEEVLDMKLLSEDEAPADSLIFLDRGMPDGLVYSRHYGADVTRVLQACHRRRYQKIFLLDTPLKYEVDYARTEDPVEARAIHEDIAKVYAEFNYEVIRIPLIPIAERVRMILSHSGK
jgi:predicted ATPase